MDRIIKYEAAAGSGKTYQLTLEYLKKVVGLFDSSFRAGGLPDRGENLIGAILAITFTNKAANEMKERILGTLKRFSLCDSPDSLGPGDRVLLDTLSVELKLDRQRIVRLSGHIIERIISHYQDFNVKTIDSLMSSIIKVVSPDLGLPPDFEIGLDASEELDRRAAEFIESIIQGDWDFFQDVLINIKNSETLHEWYVEDRIIKYLAEFFTIAQHRGIGEEPASVDIQARLFKALDGLKKSLSDLFSLIRAESGPDGIHPDINRVRIKKNLVLAVQDFLDDGQNLRKIDPIISKKMFSLQDGSDCLKKGAGDGFRDRFLSHFGIAKTRLSDFVRLLSLNRIWNFSRFFSGFLEYWENQREMIFVNEFSRTLRRKFTSWEKTALPYIYLKLSDRFRHFLFDEFQDTSELQFRALVPILEEVLVSDERSSIFLVGDRKQAIYRWRGGNADLMEEDRLKAELEPLNWLVPDSDFTRLLDRNYRSGEHIVQFNNHFWDSSNLGQMLENLGAGDRVIEKIPRNFRTARQKVSPRGLESRGFVRVSILEHPGSEVEASSIPRTRLVDRCEEIIRKLLEGGYSGSDIAVLVRSNDEGRDLVDFLENRQIPTLSDESLLLSSSVLIREIISFLRFIEYPLDHLNLYAFISGNIFAGMAEELFPDQMRKFDPATLTGVSYGTPLYKRLQELIPGPWEELVEPFVKQAGFSPPYDVFQDLTHRFRLFENFPESSPFFLTFGSILHDLEQRDINSIAAFLSEWDKNIRSRNPFAINVSDDDTRIRVLTIHKAKGLEFPVVILPLGGKSGRGGKNLFWQDGEFFHITKDYARINPTLEAIYIGEIEKEFIDELNLLYVALTRAREGLFVPLVYRPPAKPPKKDPFKTFTSFSDMMASHPWIRDHLQVGKSGDGADGWRESCWGEWPRMDKEFDRDRSPKESMPLESKHFTTSEWQRDFLVFAPADRADVDVQEAMERGDAIHRLLSRIERIQERDQVEGIVRKLAEAEGVSGSDSRLLERYLEREDVFGFFQGLQEIYNEKEIAGFIGDKIEYRRVDRLIVRTDEVLVIDYKTGSQKNGHYISQIRDYISILKPLFPKKRVGGCLLYLDLNEVEPVEW